MHRSVRTREEVEASAALLHIVQVGGGRDCKPTGPSARAVPAESQQNVSRKSDRGSRLASGSA